MEPRKASDIILELESKINSLLELIKSQDLNIKILSNKLNSVMEKLDKKPEPKIIVESVNTLPTSNEQIFVSSENKLPLEESPSGFRRTSRPETYSGDNVYLKEKPKKNIEVTPEIVVPSEKNPTETMVPVKYDASLNAVPVMQRVVDRNGKSVFLADIEIFNSDDESSVFKTRTNGTGKWMASLVPGNYRIALRKRESLTKEKLEVNQNLQIDGSKSPLELQTIIIK